MNVVKYKQLKFLFIMKEEFMTSLEKEIEVLLQVPKYYYFFFGDWNIIIVIELK